MGSPQPQCSNIRRRTFLTDVGMGFTGVALGAMLHEDGVASAADGIPDGRPHFPPKAKRVIWVFLSGGYSHMETFDPKPALNQYAGKTYDQTAFANPIKDPLYEELARAVVFVDRTHSRIFPMQTGFKKYGENGMAFAAWLPHLATCADDIALVRSMYTTDNAHNAEFQIHHGRHKLDPPEPVLGSWINYGLGSLSENLPQFINIGPRFFDKKDAHYLGPAYDAVNLKIDPNNPLDYAKPSNGMTTAEQRRNLELTNNLNRFAANQYPLDPVIEARIKSYELAFRMQTAVPDALDFSQESSETQKLYGLDQNETKSFGQQLLAARRLSERGVRFIQIMHGDGAAGAWDNHSGLKNGHSRLSRQVDLPTAGLLKDLKRRGLLEDTIVVFATEFGRTPGSQGADGRDHHSFGFSVWMAGGGIKGGVTNGATDELGYHAVEAPHYVTDVHATINHLMGIDPHKLEVPGHKRLEMDFGHVIEDIIA